MCKTQSLIKKIILLTMTMLSIVSIVIGSVVSNAKLFGMDAPNPANIKYQAQTCNLPPKTGNWAETCNLTKFNPADGKLRRVRIRITAQIKSDIGVENLDDQPGTSFIGASGRITVKDFVTNTDLVTVFSSTNRSYDLGAFDGIIDRAGTSGTTELGVLGNEETQTATYDLSSPIPASIVNSFVQGSDPGQPDKQVLVRTFANTSGSANVANKIETDAMIKQLVFTYEYFQANVGITTTHSPSVFQENSTGDIIYRITNNDNERTTAPLTLVTALPSYLTFVSSNNPNWTCTGTVTIACTTNTNLEVGASSDISFRVNTGVNTPNTYTNNVKLSYGVGEYDLTDNEFNHTIPFNHDPVAENCDTGSHQLGKTVTLINAKNPCLQGTDPDTHLITDRVVKYEIKTLPNPSNGKLTNGVTDIVVGQDVTAILDQLKFVPNNNFVGPFNFEYTVYDTFDKLDKTNGTVTGLFTETDLAIDKESPAPKTFNVGSEFDYSIKAINLKPNRIEATEFLVEDILPSELEYVSYSIVPTSNISLPFPCTFVTPKLTCRRLGSMATNEIVEFKVKVRVKDQASGIVKNTATIKSDALELNFTNNTDDDEIKINRPPVAVDCLLGQFQQGQIIDLANKTPACLDGTDPDMDDSVAKYIINSLPNPITGKLTLNGLDITLNQVITPSDRNKILFVPVTTYTGPMSFTYTVEDTKGLRDATPATVTAEFFPNDILPVKKLKTGETIFVPGSIKTYDLEVINNKPTSVMGRIIMIDTLPNSLTYVSHTAPSDWVCVTMPKELKCEANRTFLPNEVVPFTITVKVADVVTPIVVNTFRVFPEFSQDISNDEVIVENPGNNPPMAVDCDLSTSKANIDVIIKNVIANCLQGSDPDTGDSIASFIIKSLPDPNNGKITLNGVDITLEQVITPSQENDIIFVPNRGYTGDYSFTYTVEDTKVLTDLTPAIVRGEFLLEDLSVTKNAMVDTVELGKNFDYEFNITNNGRTTFANGFSFSDTLPVGMNFVTSSSNDWDCVYDNVSRLFGCTIKRDLLSKESTQVLMTVNLDKNYQNNTVTNKVDLDCLDVEVNCENNQDEEVTPVMQHDIAVLKVHEGEFKVGQIGKYKFSVTNTTKYDLNDIVTLEDTLPTGLMIQSYTVTNPDWVCITKNSSQLECNNTKGLKAMQSDIINLNVKIAENATQDITNTVTIKTPSSEKDYINNRSSDTVKIVSYLPALVRTGAPTINYNIIFILSLLFGIYMYIRIFKKENL